MNRILIILFLVASAFSTENTYEYWIYDNNSELISTQFMSRTEIQNNIYDVLRWQTYHEDKSEKIIVDYTGWPLNGLTWEQVEDCWDNAVETWNSAVANSNHEPFEHDPGAAEKVLIATTSYPDLFLNPRDNLARTFKAYETDNIKATIKYYTPNPIGQWDESKILFNDTQDFYDAFNEWVNDPNAQRVSNPSWNNPSRIDIETIALHELGHILGLGHNPHDGQATMYPHYWSADRTLSNADKEHFTNLYLIDYVVGINDDIAITRDRTILILI